jgi:hypothetical protein
MHGLGGALAHLISVRFQELLGRRANLKRICYVG